MYNIQSILENIKIVNEIGSDFSDDIFLNELNELKYKLEENNFYLVVTGLFKRGKSSIINTLIKQNIAPVAVTPVTAIITLFEFSNIQRCEVLFINNKKKEIPFTELYQYVTEDENPENIKKVNQVKVSCNSEILKKCNIVDTPGLGSVFEHNSETTYNYIPKIDAALFILSADTPVSKTDADFLNQIHSMVPRIIYVLNKAELLNDKELNKLIHFNTKIIASTTQEEEKNIVLIPISCKIASENYEKSNFKTLVNAIETLINENKTEIIIETGNHRLKHIANQMQQLLNIKAETLQLPIMDIEKKQHDLKISMEVMNETKQEFDILIKGQLDKIIEKHIFEVENALEEIKSLAKQDSIFNLTTIKILNNNTISALLEKYSAQIIFKMEKLKELTEKTIIDDFNLLLNKYQNRSKTFLSEFAKMLKELFGLSFESITSNFNLNIYTSFYFLKFTDGQLLVPKVPAIYNILPKKIKLIKYQYLLKKNLEIFIDVNKGRMIPDVRYKVTESFRKFKVEEGKQVALIYERINKLLHEAIKNKLTSKSEIEKELKTINDKIEILKDIVS